MYESQAGHYPSGYGVGCVLSFKFNRSIERNVVSIRSQPFLMMCYSTLKCNHSLYINVYLYLKTSLSHDISAAYFDNVLLKHISEKKKIGIEIIKRENIQDIFIEKLSFLSC